MEVGDPRDFSGVPGVPKGNPMCTAGGLDRQCSCPPPTVMNEGSCDFVYAVPADSTHCPTDNAELTADSTGWEGVVTDDGSTGRVALHACADTTTLGEACHAWSQCNHSAGASLRLGTTTLGEACHPCLSWPEADTLHVVDATGVYHTVRFATLTDCPDPWAGGNPAGGSGCPTGPRGPGAPATSPWCP